MTAEPTPLEGLWLLRPKVFRDARGHFLEPFNRKAFATATGMEVDFVQDNESLSQIGVVRGLHFQAPPHA